MNARAATCTLAAVLGVALLTWGCRGGLLSDPDDLPLDGTTWTLVYIDVSGDISEPPEDESYLLRFDSSGVLVGQSDCNSCEGSYHVRKSGTLVLSLGCTEAACGPGGSEIGHFPVFVSGVFVHDIDGNRLTMQKQQSSGSLLLAFDGQ